MPLWLEDVEGFNWLRHLSSKTGTRWLKQMQGSKSAEHRSLPTCINGQTIEDVDYFVYLANVVSAEDGIDLEVARQKR